MKKTNSILFALLLSLGCISCAQPQVRNDFYLGLNDRDNAVQHFENALESSNVYVRRAAAQELAELMVRGTELTSGTIQTVRREAHGPWAAAFNAVPRNPSRRRNASTAVKERVFKFLFNMEGVSEEARMYVIRECQTQRVSLSRNELAAIDGHYAVSHLRYNEALVFFRTFQTEGQWPAHLPDIFLKYPILINDLGRAFQYTASRLEGMNLFLQWEKNLITAESPAKLQEARYRLLFFAARIARRNGRNSQAVSLFEQALRYAPDEEQSDASIWYIFDLLFINLSAENGTDTSEFIKNLEKFVPLWHDGNYYNDVLEKFLQALTSRQEWGNIIHVFNLIKNTNSGKKAGYAWVIARLIEEGHFSNEEMSLAAAALAKANDKNVLISAFLEFAYNAADKDISSLLYYRSLSASALERPFFANNLRTGGRAARDSSNSPASQFIQGFFTFDAEEHAVRYIRQIESELNADELRNAAGALEQAGMYAQSIRLVSRYIARDGHTISRRDMQLLFPRPYKDLVEKYAAEMNITPEILFALIRTESAFQSSVVSRAGAVGLTQLMPTTAEEMAGFIRRAGGPDYFTLVTPSDASEEALDGESINPSEEVYTLNLTDPELNIHIGSYYLNYLMRRFDNNMLLSLLSYNGGMNRIRRWRAETSLPVDLFMETILFYETRDYGRKVLGAAEVYRELYYK